MPRLLDNHHLRRRIVLLTLFPGLAREHALALLPDLVLSCIPALDVHPVVLTVHEDDGEPVFSCWLSGLELCGWCVAVDAGSCVWANPLAADAVDASDERAARESTGCKEIAQRVLAASALAEQRVAVVVQRLCLFLGKVREAPACPARDQARSQRAAPSDEAEGRQHVGFPQVGKPAGHAAAWWLVGLLCSVLLRLIEEVVVICCSRRDAVACGGGVLGELVDYCRVARVRHLFIYRIWVLRYPHGTCKDQLVQVPRVLQRVCNGQVSAQTVA